jgi:hypothetical protein
MNPKRPIDSKKLLVQESQDVIIPTDHIECREMDQDEYYESPNEYDSYCERMDLRD